MRGKAMDAVIEARETYRDIRTTRIQITKTSEAQIV
jgi:hypothetical protein